MTRETKVGLLVGICVILLIGIIISDQLTVMQQPGAAEMTDFAVNSQSSVSPQPLPTPTATGAEAIMVPPPVRPTVPTPAELAQNAPPPEPVFINVQTQQAMVADPQGNMVPVDPTRAPNVLLTRQETTPPQPALVPANNLTDPRRNPQPIFHDVQTGQTLYTIAHRYYGNGEMWKIIRDANPDKVDARGNVKLGVRLTIPNRPGMIEGAPSSGTALATTQMPSAMRVAPAPTAASGRVVVVQKGDTLIQIARKHLGSSNRWPDIMAANRDQLSKPSDLKIGMKLRMPATAGSSAAAPVPTMSLAQAQALHGNSLMIGAPSPTVAPRPALPTPAPAAAGSGNSANPPAPGSTYVVVAGDSLSSIAAKTLGDPNQYQRLYDANRDQLPDADSIREGMVLKVPR